MSQAAIEKLHCEKKSAVSSVLCKQTIAFQYPNRSKKAVAKHFDLLNIVGKNVTAAVQVLPMTRDSAMQTKPVVILQDHVLVNKGT